MDEEDFVDQIIEKMEEKKRYAEYLEDEGSIMSESANQDQHIFRLKNAEV